MSDREFEEFTLQIGGSPYTFHFGFSEIIEMQDRLSTPSYVPSIAEIDHGIRAGRLKYQQALIWAGLRRFHRDITEEDVARLQAKATGAELRAVLVAFGYSMTPDPADVKALGEPENPQAAQAETTGERSTSTPEVTV
jgi:hypothetical protein